MVKAEVELTEEEASRLKVLAAERGVSVSALLHNAVAGLLTSPCPATDEERRQRAIAFAGRFRSNLPDLGEHHDRYLYGDLADDHLR
jgi:hypothetical protein